MASSLVNSQRLGLVSSVSVVLGLPLVLLGDELVAGVGVLFILVGAVGGILTVGMFLGESDQQSPGGDGNTPTTGPDHEQS